MSPTSRDIAWAAGIFEGEGDVFRGTSLVVRVTQKDTWILERLQALFGGSVRRHSVTRQYGACYRWAVSGARARGFAMTIYTFLSRRRQAALRTGLDH